MSMMAHIERVREKPEHIRKQIAMGAAALITAVITMLWLGASVATGSFAIKGGPFTAPPSSAPASPASSSLLGAAGAALSGSAPKSAQVEVVGSAPASDAHAAPEAEPTVIPF